MYNLFTHKARQNTRDQVSLNDQAQVLTKSLQLGKDSFTISYRNNLSDLKSGLDIQLKHGTGRVIEQKDNAISGCFNFVRPHKLRV